MLFYRAAANLSRSTLTYVAGIIRLPKRHDHLGPPAPCRAAPTPDRRPHRGHPRALERAGVLILADKGCQGVEDPIATPYLWQVREVDVKEAWKVPDDFWLLQRQIRLLRTLYMTIEGEPEQKGARGHRLAVAFQQQVVDHMVAARRRPFTGPVALDLYFETTRKNPPAIHRVAKNVLDLLGRSNSPVLPRRRSVLYRDDRQVKYLYVHLDQAWNRDESWAELTAPSDLPDPWAAVAPGLGEVGELMSTTVPARRSAGGASHTGGGRAGRTRLVARPGRDVVADLTMANRLRFTDDEDDESSPFEAPDLPDDFDDDWGVRGRHDSDAELWE
ncbi:hypothetical protein ACIBK9_25465 [Nonomuraea sp. NPDC050227]|uniref:hypothetical protein n=1 Tax=Nonomuraea sp. NPDC050227 TaxID=3364360 RepID=UPI00379E93D8